MVTILIRGQNAPNRNSLQLGITPLSILCHLRMASPVRCATRFCDAVPLDSFLVDNWARGYYNPRLRHITILPLQVLQILQTTTGSGGRFLATQGGEVGVTNPTEAQVYPGNSTTPGELHSLKEN